MLTTKPKIINVDIQLAGHFAGVPSAEEFHHWITIALDNIKEPIEAPAEISIRIVDEQESQALNDQYRGNNKPTNVLSFPAEFPEGVNLGFLGDLAICAPVVAREAREQHKILGAHWAHMVLHGTLHLLGYDHIEEPEAEAMEALEIACLDQLGFTNPYDYDHGKGPQTP